MTIQQKRILNLLQGALKAWDKVSDRQHQLFLLERPQLAEFWGENPKPVANLEEAKKEADTMEDEIRKEVLRLSELLCQTWKIKL